MNLKNAERQLKMLGLTNENIKELELMAENQISIPAVDSDCDNPDCTECRRKKEVANESAAALKKAEEKLAWYSLTAPFDGTVIEKHIVPGESVGTDSSVYIVADLSSVWVDLQVYPKNLNYIKKDQQVVISADSEIPEVSGIISFIGPVVGPQSRTALAREILDNSSGVFRPGLFVTAQAAVSKTNANVVVPKDTIQSIDGRKCVFVKDAHGFEPAFVEIGLENTNYAEILSGLDPGQEFVTTGAFALKSKIVTSTLDSHAGHNH
jgi:cobalt-zinc-cadmium efflux system membrane fusion protein